MKSSQPAICPQRDSNPMLARPVDQGAEEILLLTASDAGPCVPGGLPVCIPGKTFHAQYRYWLGVHAAATAGTSWAYTKQPQQQKRHQQSGHAPMHASKQACSPAAAAVLRGHKEQLPYGPCMTYSPVCVCASSCAGPATGLHEALHAKLHEEHQSGQAGCRNQTSQQPQRDRHAPIQHAKLPQSCRQNLHGAAK